MKKKIFFAISVMLLYCFSLLAQNGGIPVGIICTETQNQISNNTNVTPENSSTINSCGQVKITSNGSLDVHNGGVVKIKNLSMDDGATLHIH